MSQKEYRKKYGFTMRTPLAAKSLTKARSEAAKKRGLPEKLVKAMEARREEKAEATTETAIETVTAPEQKPMLTPESSIQNEKIICLECGAEMKQLTVKHLVSHGMDQKEYRQKYGFSTKTPLAAKSLIEARSQAAKKQGLPEKRKQYLEARRQSKAASTAPEPSGPEAESVKKVRRRFSPKKME
jgi:predicted transcriptional regulator